MQVISGIQPKSVTTDFSLIWLGLRNVFYTLFINLRVLMWLKITFFKLSWIHLLSYKHIVINIQTPMNIENSAFCDAE